MNVSFIHRNLVRTFCKDKTSILFCQWKAIHFKKLPLPFECSNTKLLKNPRNVSKMFEKNRHQSPNVTENVPISKLKTERHFCTKVVDLENDPETNALLKEIISDFENEKSKNVNREQVDESTKECDSKLSDQVTELEDDSSRPETEEKRSLDYSLDETRSTAITLTRGARGVFELDELVTLLQEENGRDISVIEIPPEARFAEYMVIVSALSLRHLRSISSRVKWIHKQKKDPGDKYLRVEGLETAPDWHAMDLGNIILHVFMPDTREHYDLESLWTNWGQLGQEVTEDDPYVISPEDEFWTNLEAQKGDTEKEQK